MYDRSCPNYTNTHFNCRSENNFMEKENPTLEPRAHRTPGLPYEQGKVISIPSGHVLLLWSPWAVEGVFTHQATMDKQFNALKKLASYRGEQFTYQVRRVNSIWGEEEE